MRTFGIELEMIAPQGTNPQNVVVRALSEAGLAARGNSHYGTDYTVWQAKDDSSISPRGRGMEAVSPVLTWDDAGREQARRAVEALANAGMGVNKTCGFHVHIGLGALTPRQRMLVALRYDAMQAGIDTVLSESRRQGNHFCMPFSASEITRLSRAAERNVVDSLVSIHDRPATTGTRYRRVNVAWSNVRGRESLEFRQHQATVDAGKVLGWVRFLMEMIDEVVRVDQAGAQVAQVAAAPVVPAPAPVAAPVATGRAPITRPGSNLHWVLQMLRTTGQVTVVQAAEHGIPSHVLRSLISGLRRHGAAIVTFGGLSSLGYRLANSPVLPAADAAIFTNAPMTSVQAPRQAAPAAPGAVFGRLPVLSYPLHQGLSEATVAWLATRAAEVAAAAARRARPARVA